MTARPETTTLKITNQERLRTGMAYDLKGGGKSLLLSIFPRQSSDDLGDWRIDARASRTDGAKIVSAWGPTRKEALRDIERAWCACGAADQMPAFDWEEVARALAAVRAI